MKKSLINWERKKKRQREIKKENRKDTVGTHNIKEKEKEWQEQTIGYKEKKRKNRYEGYENRKKTNRTDDTKENEKWKERAECIKKKEIEEGNERDGQYIENRIKGMIGAESEKFAWKGNEKIRKKKWEERKWTDDIKEKG